MNRHLNSEEIAAWAIGERDARTEAHIRDCPPCRAELQHLEGALLLFRDSGRRWSEHWHQAPPAPARPRVMWARRVAPGAAAAALVAVAAWWIKPGVPRTPREQPFIAIPYVAPLAPYERSVVVRMDVPVAALIAAGFEVRVPDAAAAIRADVLVGQDGRAHAIRPLIGSAAR
jgi:hypothetical protein